jgi:hypothetical protein
LGLNRVVHNLHKFKEGFLVIRSTRGYARHRALNIPIKITRGGHSFDLPTYYILTKHGNVSLPAFKEDMEEKGLWITSDKEYSYVLSNQLYKYPNKKIPEGLLK